MILNPWSAHPVRLPDHVVVPTSLGRFFANRTYNLTGCGTVGPNFIFAMNSKLSNPTSAQPPESTSAFISSVASTVTSSSTNAYAYTPGNILNPLQWGLGAQVDPHAADGLFDFTNQTTNPVNGSPGSPTQSASPWGDGFGASLASTIPFVSAYRTLAMAIRVRIVGLPPSQFMTPGKMYFAQVRYDATDMPVTEQDFVVLEQLGRASHVSADAVREAGSKTVFFVPDGINKLTMSSNFMIAPGVLQANQVFTNQDAPPQPSAGVRYLPSLGVLHASGSDPCLSIVPYSTTGGTAGSASLIGPAQTLAGAGDATDAYSADATTLLVVAYFGAQDGVVLEVDYSTVVEYIPNKSTPGGVEALVQLPSSPAMDSIYAAAAVLAEARPVMIQHAGDLTISSSSPGGSRESGAIRSRLARMARAATGGTFREGFWDFDWLKSGSLGSAGSGLNWDFSEKPKPEPVYTPLPVAAPAARAPRARAARAARPASRPRQRSASAGRRRMSMGRMR